MSAQETRAAVTFRKLHMMDYLKLRPIYTNPRVTYPAALAPAANKRELYRLVRALVAMQNEAIEVDGHLVGVIGHDDMDKGKEGERAASIGYVLRQDVWGHGYGTQAIGMYSDRLLAQGYDAVYADCFLDNPASARVLEKTGFIYQCDYVRSFSCFPKPRRLHLYKKTR